MSDRNSSAAKVTPLESVREDQAPPEHKGTRKPDFKKLAFIVVGAAVAASITKAFVSMAYVYVNFETTDNAQIAAPLRTLSTKVGGIVKEVMVADNAHVKKGDLLLKLDPREYEIALKFAQAELEAAKLASSGYNTTTVMAHEAKVEAAKLNLEFTEIHAPADGTLGKRLVEPGMNLKPNQNVFTLVDAGQRWVVANFKETQLPHIRLGQAVEIEVDALKGRHLRGKVDSFAPGSGSTFALIPPENATGNFVKVVQRVPVRVSLDADSIAGLETRLIPGLSVLVKAKKTAEGQ